MRSFEALTRQTVTGEVLKISVAMRILMGDDGKTVI